MQTIGDRIGWLLRRKGRDDHADEKRYLQADLVAWLNGDEVAPNGKKYDIGTSKQAMSRLINDKVQNLNPDVLRAICEIFDTDADWILFGESAATAPNGYDIHMTPEAGEIARIVDRLDEEDRICVLRLCQRLMRRTVEYDMVSSELLKTQKEFVYVVDRAMEFIPESQRAAMRELIAQMERSAQRLPR